MEILHWLIAINELLTSAIKTYWNWSLNYQTYLNFSKAKQISYDRFLFTKRFYEVGERPAIDTTEAYTQFKLLEYETQNAYYDWLKSTIELSFFLWNENEENVFVKENVIPINIQQFNFIDSLQLPSIAELEQLVLKHPKLNSLDIKLKNLEIERNSNSCQH